MKYLVIALLFLAPVLVAATARPPQTLQVTTVRIGDFDCDGTNHEAAADLRGANIRKIVVWMGAYKGTIADMVADVENTKGDDWTSIAHAGWDHYADPTGMQDQVTWFDFTPEGVAAKDIRIFASCNGLDEASKSKKALITVTFYYTGDK